MLGATFDMSAQIGAVTAKLDDVVNTLKTEQIMRGHPARGQEAVTPIATFTSQSQITPVAGPPAGTMVWEVNRVSFGLLPGGTITTPGTMIVFIGNVEIARTSTLPNFLTFSGYQCLVTPNDVLGVAWVGGTGSTILVDVAATEYPILGDVTVISS